MYVHMILNGTEFRLGYHNHHQLLFFFRADKVKAAKKMNEDGETAKSDDETDKSAESEKSDKPKEHEMSNEHGEKVQCCTIEMECSYLSKDILFLF